MTDQDNILEDTLDSIGDSINKFEQHITRLTELDEILITANTKTND